ncbi:unnamed protein product [Gadus morhua 'NCC']
MISDGPSHSLSVGLIDLPPVDHTFYTPPIVHVLHCTFSVVSYILLLNLLIAMMSDTHWRVAQERDELWRTQVVATTLMLERRLPRVEDRNDLMVQKMRRYINAFAKDGEGGAAEREEGEKGGESGGGPELRSNKQRRGFNKVHAGWQAIRRSALSMDLEPEYEEEEQEVRDIRFV